MNTDPYGLAKAVAREAHRLLAVDNWVLESYIGNLTGESKPVDGLSVFRCPSTQGLRS
jgi:hypothetical protein